jgi:NAD(P) transhydrogenase subunit beta
MSANLSSTLFLLTGILFILALRGLSSPETSRMGNLFGILGMALAIVVSILSVDIFLANLVYFIIALTIGGSIGGFIAFRIPMTAMPQLVAGFHSLVGLAAVLVAISAYYNPEAFGLGNFQNIKTASIIEMGLGSFYWCHYIYWFNNSLYEITGFNVWLTNYFSRSTYFKCFNRNTHN